MFRRRSSHCLERRRLSVPAFLMAAIRSSNACRLRGSEETNVQSVASTGSRPYNKKERHIVNVSYIRGAYRIQRVRQKAQPVSCVGHFSPDCALQSAMKTLYSAIGLWVIQRHTDMVDSQKGGKASHKLSTELRSIFRNHYFRKRVSGSSHEASF